jgi:ankyrin repeat protein
MDLQLHEAAAKGQFARVKELLVSGADVDTADADGRAALHLAAKASNLQVAQLLPAAGIRGRCQCSKRTRSSNSSSPTSN